MNKVIILGNLARTPELKKSSYGSFCFASVATTERWTDKNGQKQELTEWHDVMISGKTAEYVCDKSTKGQQVFIEGRIRTSPPQGDEKFGRKKVKADIVKLVWGPKTEASGNVDSSPQFNQDFTHDDIPF